MSRALEALYEMEKQRREIEQARVREMNEKFLSQYRSMLREFEYENFDDYVPDEMNRIRSLLSQAESMQNIDAFEARECSRSVGDLIYGMRSIARDVRLMKEAEERERERRREEERQARKTAATEAYYGALKKIKGAAIQNFAKDELAKIRKSIENNMLTSVDEINNRIAAATEVAEKKAAEWKQQTIEKARKEGVSTQIEASKQQLCKEKNLSKEKKDAVLKSLDELLGRVKNTDVKDLQSSLHKIDNTVPEQIVSDEIMVEVTRFIIMSLRNQGFSVDAKNVSKAEINGEKVYRVVAEKENGKRASCYLDNKGKIHYAFDKYEGKNCLKDIQKFKVDLEKVYSVKLSDERVLWENPDRLDKNVVDTTRSDNR